MFEFDSNWLRAPDPGVARAWPLCPGIQTSILLGDGERIVAPDSGVAAVLSKKGLTAHRPGDKVQLPRRA